MGYGERRVNKLPSEFRLGDYFGLASAGALGIIAAIGMDMRQSGDASALFVINKWMAYLGNIFGFGELSLMSVVLILMAVGALSIFYFQPVSFQGAFAQGFGVLASLMTIAPSDLGGALGAPVEAALPVSVVNEALYAPEPYTPESRNDYQTVAMLGSISGQVASLATTQNIEHGMSVSGAEAKANSATYTTASVTQDVAATYNITIEVQLPEGLAKDMDEMIRSGTLRGRLFDDGSKQTYNIFRNGGAIIDTATNRITIRTSIPSAAANTTLWARIECDKYAIAVESFAASQGDNPVWVIAMTPNNTPLFLQRLGKSYWF